MERKEFLSDVMVTAIEGGINYWVERFLSCTRENGFITGVAFHSDGRLYTVFGRDIERAITEVKNTTFKVRQDIREAVILADAQNDASDVDAEVADVLVQAAVFGEIVYG